MVLSGETQFLVSYDENDFDDNVIEYRLPLEQPKIIALSIKFVCVCSVFFVSAKTLKCNKVIGK